MKLGMWEILWLTCAGVTIVASVFATRAKAWLYTGRIATAVLFLFGGATLHITNLIRGDDYSGFADPAHFSWVTTAWEAVVPANPLLWIGLLTIFEIAVGILALTGGRWTQLAYGSVLAFYLALTLFGGFQLVFFLVMLVPMLLLLRAERREAAGSVAPVAVKTRPPVAVG